MHEVSEPSPWPSPPWPAPTPIPTFDTQPPQRPPTKQRRRWWTVSIAIVLVLALLSGLVFAVTGNSGTSYPKTWDSSVQPIVSFVEKSRGLTFKHVVPIKFMASAEFDKTLTADQSDSSASDPITEAKLRAVGLIGAKTNLRKDTTKITTNGVLAFYSNRDRRVVVRGTGSIDVSTRVTLAHELTHALQDQYFDISALYDKAPKGADDAVTTLIEGDASAVEDLYVTSLSPADQDAYDKAQKSGYDQYKKDTADVTPVLDVSFGLPYELGRALIGALRHDGGTKRIDAAFKNPPLSELAIMRPSVFLRGEIPAVVHPPTPAAGEKALGSPEVFGALTLYLMLVQRIDARIALAAADDWTGDETLAVKKTDGTICVRAAITADTTTHTSDIEHALESWAKQGPAGAASASLDGAKATFVACDPGANAPTPTDHTEVLRLPINRALIANQLLDSMNLAEADCIVERAITTLTFTQLDNPTDPVYDTSTFQDQLRSWEAACRGLT